MLQCCPTAAEANSETTSRESLPGSSTVQDDCNIAAAAPLLRRNTELVPQNSKTRAFLLVHANILVKKNANRVGLHDYYATCTVCYYFM